jgi:LPXTG-site transpeptidase (sortase) family protein
LPNTGFIPGQVTHLPGQLEENAYTGTGILLDIPSLEIKTSVVGVPEKENQWDVTWLGNHAGYLYGSAYPTWAGNTVITGHVWNADNTPGIFANLKMLKLGDRFYLRAFGQVYTYEVRDTRLVTAGDISTVFQSEKLDWITLATCEGYDAGTAAYPSRRIVRAVLVKVE